MCLYKLIFNLTPIYYMLAFYIIFYNLSNVYSCIFLVSLSRLFLLLLLCLPLFSFFRLRLLLLLLLLFSSIRLRLLLLLLPLFSSLRLLLLLLLLLLLPLLLLLRPLYSLPYFSPIYC